MADAISKGDLATLREQWPGSVVSWIRDPVEDMDLGYKVLRDLERSGLGVVLLEAD